MSTTIAKPLTPSQKQIRALQARNARDIKRAGKLGPATFPAVPPKDHPATAFIAIYDDDETEFLRAIDEFKARTGRRFPLHTDMLAIIKSLGYTRGTAMETMNLPCNLSKPQRVKAIKKMRERHDDKNAAKEVAAATGMSERSAKRNIRLAKTFDDEQLDIFEQMGTSQDDMTAVAQVKHPAMRAKVVALIASGLSPKAAITKITCSVDPAGPTRPIPYGG